MSGTYDFKTLSHLDFEELVHDLLQVEWSVQLESFSTGPDQGIDFRFLNGPHRWIVQAKHMHASGFSALRNAVAKERCKALQLAPSRYILVTSVPLTPTRKAKLVEAMAGVPLTPSDILGQEDLNAILRRHSQIERQHFKLWLSSVPVLERILHSGVYNRTAAEMDIITAMVPRFVQNRSVGEAERLLADGGSLIIAGPPGVGKTTLARILLWLHAEQGWNIYVVDALEEAFAFADGTEKRLILLDDFLGQVRLSADHVRGVDARLPPLVARVAAHDNLRFVLTTRDYILAQARRLSARMAPTEINAREYVLNVGRYTRTVKARILYNHLYFGALTPEQRDAMLADDFYLKIIDHKNFNPRIIQEITKPQYLALTDGPIRETIERVLANPEMLWELPYREHITKEGRTMMVALFINGRAATPDVLRQSYARVARALGLELHPAEAERSFRATYKSLDGSVLGLTFDLVTFANPSLRDFLQSVVLGDNLIPLLLPVVETVSELRELWAVSDASEPSDSANLALAPLWTAALDRVASNCNRFDYLELAADMCSALSHEPLHERLEIAVDAFSGTILDESDVSKICSLLEKSSSSSLSYNLEEAFRDAATRAAADLLIGEADSLSVEDIQSLNDALHYYGSGGTAVATASQVVRERVERSLDDEMDQIESVEELDEFEESLIKFMNRHAYPTNNVVRDIGYRRDRLLEEGRIAPRTSYSSRGNSVTITDVSNSELRSIFNELKGE